MTTNSTAQFSNTIVYLIRHELVKRSTNITATKYFYFGIQQFHAQQIIHFLHAHYKRRSEIELGMARGGLFHKNAKLKHLFLFKLKQFFMTWYNKHRYEIEE